MNIANFTKVLEYIEAHPEEWDQGSYYDGYGLLGDQETTCKKGCFAFHAARMAGETSKNIVRISDAANEFLGLSGHHGQFYCTRTLADFRQYLADAIAQEGTPK